MPYPVEYWIFNRPDTLQMVAKVSRTRIPEALDYAIRQFRQRGQNLVDIAKRHGMISSEREEQHLRRHLLNEDGQGWWPHAQPIEPIIRAAFLKTAELVKEHDLPAECYWACSGRGTDAPFEASVSVSPQQVTLIFHTPAPPRGPRGRVVKDRSIFIVRRERGRVVVKMAETNRVVGGGGR